MYNLPQPIYQVIIKDPLILQKRLNINFQSGAGKIQVESGDNLRMQHAQDTDFHSGNHHFRTASREIGFIWNRYHD